MQHLDHQFADESDARYRVLAPQMAALKLDVLLAITLPPTLALKKVHGDIPLVFLGSLDPLASGVVDNLAQALGLTIAPQFLTIVDRVIE